MIAMEMSREPSIRQHVRELYFSRACVSCRPTMTRGFNEIDESHPCFAQKYLRMKSCTDFERDDFLKLVQAELDGLMTIKFELKQLSASSLAPPSTDTTLAVTSQLRRNGGDDDDDWDDDNGRSVTTTAAATTVASKKPTSDASKSITIADKIKSFYLKDEFSYNVEKWNEQRALIIDELLEKFLYPEMERELRAKLVAEAKEYIYKGT